MKTARALVAAAALAAGPAMAAEPPLPLRYDLATDLSVTAAALASVVNPAVPKPELTLLQCRICAPGRIDDAVHGALLWGESRRGRHLVQRARQRRAPRRDARLRSGLGDRGRRPRSG